MHDLVDQMRSVTGMLWRDEPLVVKDFVARGGVEAAALHGIRVEASDQYRQMWCERAAHLGEPGSSPKDRFLLRFEVTGDRDDWVESWVLRGWWHAEHCRLSAKDRNDGIKLLLSMGASRGRVKGVGGVLRGVREYVPGEAERLVVEVFGATVVSRG